MCMVVIDELVSYAHLGVHMGICYHWRIQGGAPGTRAPLGVQILSFSCSFRQKNWKIIALLGVGAPPWGKSWIRHWLHFHLMPFCTSVCLFNFPLNHIYLTRMHSSRMRTGRTLTVFQWRTPTKKYPPPEKISPPKKNTPPPLWTEWMTDACENITLAKTSFRPVKMCFELSQYGMGMPTISYNKPSLVCCPLVPHLYLSCIS